MIYLACSVLASSLIFVVFRILSNKQINLFPTLVINYWIAAALGLALFPNWTAHVTQPLLLFSVFLGSMFIGIFYSMAKTTALFGVGIASVITKMSLIIPVLVGFTVFNESISWMCWVGIGLGILSIFFNTYSKESSKAPKKAFRLFIFPALCFFGSGIIDAAIQAGEKEVLSAENMPAFIMLTFLIAAIAGTATLFIKAQSVFQKPIVYFGTGLGIINYFSIYFLIQALSSDVLSSSVIFPLNNISIVALSVFFSIVWFKEKLNNHKRIGLALSFISIYLISS